MHEMSVIANLLDIVRQEMKKHDAGRLRMVRLRYGVLANIVPESLTLAFEVQTHGTPFAGARLELRKEPLRLCCGGCGKEFSPAATTAATVFSICPACAEEIGHIVLSGRELYVESLELE